LTPNSRVHLKIRLSQPLAIVIAPETDRKGWVSARGYEFACLACVLNVVARRVEDLDFHAESFALHL
jgi:hypothetical protein